MKNKKRLTLTFVYILLIVLSIIWLFPIVWVVLTSFRGEGTAYVNYFIPKTWTLDNYIKLFTSDAFPFGQWFLNTLFVASATCVISTFITVAMAYSLSRIKFKHRNGFLKLALVLNMFPGFMSMIAVYYILKAFNLDQTLLALILVYSAGAALGFYIAKGFFDTIPYSLDESAMIDGATRADIFFKITLPLSNQSLSTQRLWLSSVLGLISSLLRLSLVMRQVNTLLPLAYSQCCNKIPSMTGSCHSLLVQFLSLFQSHCSSCLCKNTTLKALLVVQLNKKKFNLFSLSIINYQKSLEQLSQAF